ncbi:glycosyltransferase [Yeosuana sp. MJ-SS3]|uniref:Glycosyltransferase n=1 Tax=Gilvirhabdus luticola TaxID=3079858 RepID=A0ABU3UA64_9FLAO|nr:glycosyltransferase [Yeosuana sp. MJ-SS3]MDU8887303.1 glycosyltransferase [Yeosuana sp. MJ-SS3]
MKVQDFSFIIPVYNRPEEVKELLESFVNLNTNKTFEIVIIEDGSPLPSKQVIDSFTDKLNISYYIKNNTGPGDSRNFGMQRAKGNYFIILDSDCVLPKEYLNNVISSLNAEFTDCFGGPDAADNSFTNLQKAINFAMTSFISTGGIRGKSQSINEFQPRSFNMGISKTAFEASKGFGRIHPGEDPDLSIRLKKLGFNTKLISEALVFHKRRISWSKFYNQVYKFGLARGILNKWHPKTKKITYWFPSLFILMFVASLICYFLNFKWLLIGFTIYFTMAFIISLISNKNIIVAMLSVFAIGIQFYGYGYGFLKSTFFIDLLNKDPEEQFPNLFFK